MNRVAIIDYGMGNLDSVRRAVEECGGVPLVSEKPEALDQVDRIILPGVGAFPEGMRNLQLRSLDKALEDQVLGEGVPFLGICLGMQLLATTGWEGSKTAGLGWIDADVRRLSPTKEDRRVPHVGWNEVVSVSADCPLFAGVDEKADFYFVHSYHVDCQTDDHVAAVTPYCGGFASVLQRDLVFAVQFHPEKSQRNGFQLLRNFLGI